jgi:hypothetical protein
MELESKGLLSDTRGKRGVSLGDLLSVSRCLPTVLVHGSIVSVPRRNPLWEPILHPIGRGLCAQRSCLVMSRIISGAC